MFAGLVEVPEVCIFFDDKLLRGNRSRKVSSHGLAAFDSPNFPPLATLGVGINLNTELVLPPPRARFNPHTDIDYNIAVVWLVPGFDDTLFEALAGDNSKVRAIVLALYGCGNAPTQRASFLEAIRCVTQRGIHVVAVSQCVSGTVEMSTYQTGQRLKEVGVIDAGAMTIESAVCKLAYLLSRQLSYENICSAMLLNLRGERSPPTEEGIKHDESRFRRLIGGGIGGISSHL
jgi:L-asparaginase